jgi:cobalt-zinc-cadmium resistance protein CzcA
MTEPVGALIALKLTHTAFSVSSVLELLALMGVSVETAVILVSYINKLRLENNDIRTATREASLLRLRPIMMTAPRFRRRSQTRVQRRTESHTSSCRFHPAC